MLSYQIGKIDGRWNNFLPPIRGGTFRKYSEPGEPDTAEYRAEILSQASTPPRSPIFEAAEPSNKLRRRGIRKYSDLHEVSFLSSLSSIKSLENPKISKLSHMDAYTQQEIYLDLAKYPALDHATQDNIVQRYRILND